MPHSVRPAQPEPSHATGEPPAHDRVVFHPCSAQPSGHDVLTEALLAASLARLLGIDFAGEYDARQPPGGRLYFVPSETLPEHDAAPLGIRQPHDLYGGVTPRPFVATKVITHPLVKSDAAAPAGWSPRFGDRVRDVVLEGFSVFSATDARLAGTQLLSGGAVRVKHPDGVGGAGQTVVSDLTELESVPASMNDAELRRDGLVLERNLEQVRTHSVGQVQVGRWRISYCGHQRLTRNHAGHQVYGGSNLRVVRGGYDTLLELELPDAVRTAVEKALAFREAAVASFPGLYASRSNYDIAQGYDAAGIRTLRRP